MILVQRHDDATRTVTTYDETGAATGTRPYTADENAAADAAVADAARLDSIEDRLARIEAHLWPAAPDEPPTDPDTVGTWPGILYPGQTYRETDGRIIRNATTVPLTTAMSAMPGGGIAWIGQLWEVVTSPEPDPDPEPGRPEGYVGPWSADAEYAVGNVVDRNGRYYRAKVAHGAAYAGTWGPPLPSVWDVVGPVA